VSKQEHTDSEQNITDQIAREIFGYDEASLLAEFEAAEQEAREIQNKGSMGAENGLEDLKSRLRMLDIQPIYQADYEEEEKVADEPDPPKRKPARLKRMSKVIVIAAVMGVVVFGSVMVSVGKLSLRYWGREIDESQARVVWNNVDKAVSDLALEDAYNKIGESLDIKIIHLGYIPDGMEYQGVVVERGYANIKFLYNDKIVTMVQMKESVENSVSFQVDRNIYDTVENGWIDHEIVLSRNQLENGQVEYQADIVTKGALYSLQGIMTEEEFQKIIQNLWY